MDISIVLLNAIQELSLKQYEELYEVNQFNGGEGNNLETDIKHSYNNKHKGDILKSEKPAIVLFDSLESFTDNPQYLISHLLKNNPNCQFICTTNSKDALGVISGYETYNVFNKE